MGVCFYARLPPSSALRKCPQLSPIPILRRPPCPPILKLSGATRTMVINALIINGSDPGAVPGDSTNSPFHLGRVGSK